MSEHSTTDDAVPFEEAAKILGVTPEKIAQYVNAGVLAAKALPGNPHDIGLTEKRVIPRQALDQFAAKLAQKE